MVHQQQWQAGAEAAVTAAGCSGLQKGGRRDIVRPMRHSDVMPLCKFVYKKCATQDLDTDEVHIKLERLSLCNSSCVINAAVIIAFRLTCLKQTW